jgi:hypothetical protein
MSLWSLVLLMLVLFIAYQMYTRDYEGFVGDIKQKVRPLLRNVRRRSEAMTKKMKRKYEWFSR